MFNDFEINKIRIKQTDNNLLTLEDKILGKYKDGVFVFAKSENYADDFGLQWENFPKTQFDSFSGKNISKARMEEALQSDLSELRDKKVLEIGSGSGRFTEILAQSGAYVDTLDLSKAIFVNQRNNSKFSNKIRFIQSDFLKVPLPKDEYDYVLALGVVQHTPDSYQTINEMISYSKKGGKVIFDHYIKGLFEGNNRRLTARLLRKIILKFNQKEKLSTIKLIYNLFYPLHKFFGFSKFLSKVLRTFSPIMTHHGSLDLTDDQFYEWGLLDTHDNLTDYYSHKISVREMRDFLNSLEIDSSSVFKGTNGINVLIKK